LLSRPTKCIGRSFGMCSLWRMVRYAVLLLPMVVACSRPPPDSTPDGVVRLWLEKMEASSEDPRAALEAYGLLGPSAKHNLEQRAERAGRMQGRRFEPYEMLAEGRFGLKFRPKTMTVRSVGADEAEVDIVGGDPAEHASVRCARDPQNSAAW